VISACAAVNFDEVVKELLASGVEVAIHDTSLCLLVRVVVSVCTTWCRLRCL
jgi:hypothetical protein